MLRTNLRFPRAERRLVLLAALLQSAIRLALSVLPYATVRRLVDTAAGSPGGVRPAGAAGPIARAVARTNARVPGANCLTQALAGVILLRRGGWPATLHVGFGRSEEGGIRGHAWVEIGGAIVLGAEAGRPALVDVERLGSAA